MIEELSLLPGVFSVEKELSGDSWKDVIECNLKIKGEICKKKCMDG